MTTPGLLRTAWLTGSGLSRGGLTAIVATLLASPAHAALTDLQIGDAVHDEIDENLAIRPGAVDVSVVDGIVELKGTVTNLLAKSLAVSEAQTVRGVRSVVDLIEVVPRLVKSDEALGTDVRNALLYDPVTEAWQITSTVSNGRVTLTGTVDSHAEAELAEKVVEGVEGVKQIENQIAVTYSVERSDQEIAAEVRERLRWDALVDQLFVKVAVNDGTVRLSGTAGSAAEVSRAAFDAWVAGVKAVDTDELVVADWKRDKFQRGGTKVVSDKAIEGAVSDALLWDPRVISSSVRVSVVGGEATLRGIVKDARAKCAAERDARFTTGVRSVSNRLKVRANASKAELLEERITQAMGWDPYLSSHAIAVDVSGSHARISGVVDNNFEKDHAEDVAYGIDGVQTVTNALSVVNHNTLLRFNPYSYYDLYYPGLHPWYSYAPTPFTSDREIREDIRDELFWSPFVDSDEVNVYVDDGVATLTGRVDSYGEASAAVENAFEGGAVAVDNELRIENEEED